MMEGYIAEFEQYLSSEKRMAYNSVLAYSKDIAEFKQFAEGKGIDDFRDVTNTEVISYLMRLKNSGKSSSTVNRKLASVRAFFQFLISKGRQEENPAANIKSPKVERREVEYLTIEEVETLVSAPDNSLKGIRDKALLELMYAAGLRAGEAEGANLAHINLRIGFITCGEENGKARIIPLGRPAREALERYIYEARPSMIRGKEDCGALFINHRGFRLTRQGIWKIMKEYGVKVGIQAKLNPQILRNSFAVHMIQNGADLKSLQELLGHEDLSATQIYLSASKNRIKDVYDKTHPRA